MMTDAPLITISDEPIPLGASGINVSPIAWGMWRITRHDANNDVGAVIARIEACLEAGISLFDTADIYGADSPSGFGSAEALLGLALAQRPDLRNRMVIATKGGLIPGVPYCSTANYLHQALDASLKRLCVSVVDLYQIHRRDFLTHPRDVAAALAAMVECGKVRAIGVSNHTPAEFDALQAFLPFPIASTQPEFSVERFSPLYDGTLDQAMSARVAVLAWSPLAGGRLVSDLDNSVTQLLAKQGQRYGTDTAAAALSWVMAHPSRAIPIIGSQTPERILMSRDALKVSWSRSEWYAVLAASRGKRMP